MSGWANSGNRHSCGTWSPAVSTVNHGETFTQTRSCSQDQVRTYTHKLGSTTVHTRDESQTISATESQSATGTKQNWVAADSTFTAWVDSGAGTNLGAWTPAVASQTANFTQTQSYDQAQTRNEQPRQQVWRYKIVLNSDKIILNPRFYAGCSKNSQVKSSFNLDLFCN